MQAYMAAAEERDRIRQDAERRIADQERQLLIFQNLAKQQGVVNPEQAQAAEKPKSKWSPPEYNPQWTRLLQMNPRTGLYEAAVPGSIDPSIVEKANARANWEREWQAKFAENPYEFIASGLEEKFQQAEEKAYERAIQYFQSLEQERALSSNVEKTVHQHSEWLYQKDSLGNVGRDARGLPLLTEKGQSYVRAVETLYKAGVVDPATQDQLALSMIGHNQAQVASAPSRAEQYAGQPAARNLAEALHSGNRNGASKAAMVGEVGEPATPGSFLALAAGPMRERGIALSSSAPTPI
jgi:hypothetical protein